MKKSDEGNAKQPYMYIVQPEISPPNANMQSQYRTVVEQEEAAEMIDGDDKEQINEEEIRIVASEKVLSPKIIEESDDEEKEVVEVSTGVTDGLDGEDSKKRKVIRKPKQQKKKKFSDMSKEELLQFLARMPAAVPKPLCTIYIGGEQMTGQIQKKKGERYIVKVQLENRSDIISVTSSDIDDITVDNL